MEKSTKEILFYCLGGVIIVMALIIIIGLFFIKIPEENKDLLNITVGVILSGFMAVVGFFFGSSQGSKDKTEAITKNSIQ